MATDLELRNIARRAAVAARPSNPWLARFGPGAYVKGAPTVISARAPTSTVRTNGTYA